MGPVRTLQVVTCIWTCWSTYLTLSSLLLLYTSQDGGGISRTLSLPVAPPRPTKTPPKPGQSEGDHRVEEEMDDLGLEYGRYLQEVVQALEQDKEFAKKLENVSQEEIRSGMIAQQLDLVGHQVRNKLDELKRVELDRLRKLARKEHELEEKLGGNSAEQDGRQWRTVDSKTGKWKGPLPEHVNVDNPHRFEVEDLHKLIQSATRDLEELDAKRRDDFKRYEMEKEHQYRENLKQMNETQKAEAERKHAESQQKHKQHPKVHAPGSKAQLEEVWEQQDHMPKQEFNPKVFFTVHDINGDGFLDQEEVEALLSIEIKKIYDPEHNPEDDPNEMMEEYHRMREHIYKEADLNKDGLISKKEFLDFTQKAEFEQDQPWEGVGEDRTHPEYTEQELQQYEAQRQMLMQHYAQNYAAYPHQGYDPNQLYYPQGYHPQAQVGYDPQTGQLVQMHPGAGGVPMQGGQHPNQQYYQYQHVDPNQQQHHAAQQIAYAQQAQQMGHPGQVGYGAPQIGQQVPGQGQQMHPQQQAAQVAAQARAQQIAMNQQHGQAPGQPGFIGQGPPQPGAHPGVYQQHAAPQQYQQPSQQIGQQQHPGQGVPQQQYQQQAPPPQGAQPPYGSQGQAQPQQQASQPQQPNNMQQQAPPSQANQQNQQQQFQQQRPNQQG